MLKLSKGYVMSKEVIEEIEKILNYVNFCHGKTKETKDVIEDIAWFLEGRIKTYKGEPIKPSKKYDEIYKKYINIGYLE